MRALLTASQRLQALADRIGMLAAWLIVALVLVIMTDVTLRHFFVIGSTKLQELEWHLHGALFLLGLGWAYGRGAHVRIELLSECWSARTRAWVELIGCLLFLLPYAVAVIWFGLDYVGYSLEYNEASPSATGLPARWLIKSAIPIGFTLLACAAAARALDSIVYLFGSEAERRETAHAAANKEAGEPAHG